MSEPRAEHAPGDHEPGGEADRLRDHGRERDAGDAEFEPEHEQDASTMLIALIAICSASAVAARAMPISQPSSVKLPSANGADQMRT